LTFSFFKKI